MSETYGYASDMSDHVSEAYDHARDTYDFVIVGGGTAGCVLAARLTEDPELQVCLIEGGPTDQGNDQVLLLKNWVSLLEGPLDYNYGTVEQPRGNSFIRHSRARVLGGCSSHNTMISFIPLPSDLDEWASLGADGWDAATFLPYAKRVQANVVPVAEKDRNQVAVDFLTAANAALGVPVLDDFNAQPFADGVGFFSLGYHPEDGRRSSSSVAYLHDVLGSRPNLTVEFETRVLQIEFDEQRRAVGVRVRRDDHSTSRVGAAREVVLCAGSVDTPRLLLLSGVGPAAQLAEFGIPLVADIPGVGEHLIDHPESVIMWEASRKLPPEHVMDFDAGLFVRRDPSLTSPDLMFHFGTVPWTLNTGRLGYLAPEHGISMTPNIPKPRTSGRLFLTSPDPDVHPALDFRYFVDDGYDEGVLVDGLKIARTVAATEPLARWIGREVAPGPDVVSDEDLSAYARSVAHTVYHPSGTCRMGSLSDPLVVVDPSLRVREVSGLRIVDGSIFPTMPTVNPVITTMMIGERAADLLKETAR
ncbi:MAG TPA: GMC family oxidoreductase N-terminal domain-containing protein [Frankiaceae bacterium]|nr:GMC family oxidoreductase N-terminal domain-containing protein [Frankiaceae bacterium]